MTDALGFDKTQLPLPRGAEPPGGYANPENFAQLPATHAAALELVRQPASTADLLSQFPVAQAWRANSELSARPTWAIQPRQLIEKNSQAQIDLLTDADGAARTNSLFSLDTSGAELDGNRGSDGGNDLGVSAEPLHENSGPPFDVASHIMTSVDSGVLFPDPRVAQPVDVGPSGGTDDLRSADASETRDLLSAPETTDTQFAPDVVPDDSTSPPVAASHPRNDASGEFELHLGDEVGQRTSQSTTDGALERTILQINAPLDQQRQTSDALSYRRSQLMGSSWN